MEKLDIKIIDKDGMTDTGKWIIHIAYKVNEIVDSINSYTSQPNCKHNWVQGTSGYWCDKCNKYKV